MNSLWVTQKYVEHFRLDPNIKLSGVRELVKADKEVDISNSQAYRARKKSQLKIEWLICQTI